MGYFGTTVHAAARIAAAGHGGQILVSGATSALLDRSDLTDLGTHRIDGDEHRILQLGAGRHPPLRTEGSRRGNLPQRPSRLIGREKDLEVVLDAVAKSAVVTLVGPGGIGKTRLALAAAQVLDALGRTSGAGAWVVELADITSCDDVPRAVADALEVTERSGRTVTRSVVESLQSGRALVLLDNCEHVVDGAAALAHALAEGCPDVRVLATSREALGVRDEQLVPVTPLDPAGHGVELFAERARAVSPTFDPQVHRGDVEEICRRLDGIPLAIELAAARSRTLAPPDLVERLSDRLQLLTGGRRSSAERHRTLRATMAWSYDLLTKAPRVLLQRISIFTGPFDVAAARSVAAGAEVDPTAVDDLLGDLVERSMLVVESSPFGRRFRLLETMREFAAEHLSRDGHPDVIAGRHARWCLDQVTHIHRLLVGPAEVEGVARLAQLWPNLRGAVDRACAAEDHELAAALVRPIAGEVNLRRQTEICDWAERILAILPADDEQVVYWLACAAYRHLQSGDHDGYELLVRRHGEPDHALVRYTRAYLYDDSDALVRCSPDAVAWLRGQGEDHAAALTEIGSTSGLLSAGRLGEVDAVASVLADRYRVQGPPTLYYVALALLGYSALYQGDTDRADQLFDEAAGVEVPARTPSVNKPVEARAAFRRGDRPRAFRILRSHIDELLETRYTEIARDAAVEFVNMMVAIDRLPDAARVLSYLTTTGDFGALAIRTLVADAASKIAAGPGDTAGPEQAPGPQLDAHQALEHMRDVLDAL